MIELCIMAIAVLLTMLGYAVLCWIGGGKDE
jgi:hypothetical protein